MLGFNQFQQLPLDTKAELLWQDGIFLTNTRGRHLYSYGGFYVEMIMNFRLTKIGQIKAFKKVPSLDMYLKEIDLEKLMS